jgi:hypothetical protein
MKTNEYDQQAEHFLTSNGIKFRATLSDTKAPAWSDGGKHGHHYRVTLSKPAHRHDFYPNRHRLTFDFWSSIADAEKGIETVSPYSVLACISGDAYTPETFADFCAEYGYGSDSIRALADVPALLRLRQAFAGLLHCRRVGAVARDQLTGRNPVRGPVVKPLLTRPPE